MNALSFRRCLPVIWAVACVAGWGTADDFRPLPPPAPEAEPPADFFADFKPLAPPAPEADDANDAANDAAFFSQFKPLPPPTPEAETEVETPAENKKPNRLLANREMRLSTRVDDGQSPPWASGQPAKVPLPSLRPTSARDLMPNLQESEYATFVDGQTVPTFHEPLMKILYRLPRFGLDNLDRLASHDSKWGAVAENPSEHRIGVFRLQGRVKGIEEVKLPSEMVRFLEFARYYRLRFEPHAGGAEMIVFARQIPHGWKPGAKIDERAGMYGLFLQVGEPIAEGKQPPLVFAADRVAWYPDRADESAGISADDVALAELGFDFSNWEEVRSRNGKELGSGDSEGFYQLLASIGRTSTKALGGRAGTLDLAAMLQKPAEFHGKPVKFHARARQVAKVLTHSPAVKERLGIDHYYQIDAFVSLGKQRVRLGKGDDPNSPVFHSDFPVTICVRSLPPELKHVMQQLSQSPERSQTLNERLEFTGVFFKVWAYPSQYVAEKNDRLLQVSPMFIATPPKLAPLHIDRYSPIGNFGLVMFVGGSALIWFAMWRYSRADRKFQKFTVAPRFRDQQGPSLNDANFHVQDKPDFSGLK